MYGFAISISDNDTTGTAQQQSLVSSAPAWSFLIPRPGDDDPAVGQEKKGTRAMPGRLVSEPS
jgi:hypothetical protein